MRAGKKNFHLLFEKFHWSWDRVNSESILCSNPLIIGYLWKNLHKKQWILNLVSFTHFVLTDSYLTFLQQIGKQTREIKWREYFSSTSHAKAKQVSFFSDTLSTTLQLWFALLGVDWFNEVDD